MDEGRKRVLAIVEGIIVARHLDTADVYSVGVETIKNFFDALGTD